MRCSNADQGQFRVHFVDPEVDIRIWSASAIVLASSIREAEGSHRLVGHLSNAFLVAARAAKGRLFELSAIHGYVCKSYAWANGGIGRIYVRTNEREFARRQIDILELRFPAD